LIIDNATTPQISLKNRLFSDINVLHGSVATFAGYGGIFNNSFTANLLENQPAKEV